MASIYPFQEICFRRRIRLRMMMRLLGGYLWACAMEYAMNMPWNLPCFISFFHSICQYGAFKLHVSPKFMPCLIFSNMTDVLFKKESFKVAQLTPGRHCGIAWHCMALHGIAWHCMALHGIAWHCMALHGIAAWLIYGLLMTIIYSFLVDSRLDNQKDPRGRNTGS